MLTTLILFSCLLGSSNTNNLNNLSSITIQIADDDAQWPPFIYYERNSKKIVGFSIDVIKLILNKHNIIFNVELAPCPRVLEGVKQSKPYHMILNASYYSLYYALFYSKKKYPNGIASHEMKHITDNYRLCGLKGYCYEDVKLKEKDVDIVSLYSYDDFKKV